MGLRVRLRLSVQGCKFRESLLVLEAEGSMMEVEGMSDVSKQCFGFALHTKIGTLLPEELVLTHCRAVPP